MMSHRACPLGKPQDALYSYFFNGRCKGGQRHVKMKKVTHFQSLYAPIDIKRRKWCMHVCSHESGTVLHGFSKRAFALPASGASGATLSRPQDQMSANQSVIALAQLHLSATLVQAGLKTVSAMNSIPIGRLITQEHSRYGTPFVKQHSPH
jgi:hypothetical protein